MLLIALSSGVHAQTLVNQSISDTLGKISTIYRYSKIIPIGNGNQAVLRNTLGANGIENLVIDKLDKEGKTIQSYTYRPSAGTRNFGSNVYYYQNYLYAVGFTTTASSTAALACNTIKLNIATWDTVWTISEQIDSAVTQVPVAVAVDASEDVYICASVATSAENKIVTIKYGRYGTKLWQSNYLKPQLNSYPVAMAITDGMVAVTGYRMNATGYNDFISLLIEPNTGALLADIKSQNGNGTISQPVGLAIDAQKNTYVVGTSTTSGANSVIKIVKYDSLFHQLWVTTYGDSMVRNAASSLYFDNSNSYYPKLLVVGTSPNGSRGSDIVTLKYDSYGNLLWSRKLSGEDPSWQLTAVAITGDGSNSYVTGISYNGSDTSIVTVAYSSDGELLWSKTEARSTGTKDVPQSISMSDDKKKVYVTAKSEGADTSYIAIKYELNDTYLPQDTTPPAIAYAYYQNQGQILDDSGAVATDVNFYTNFGHPQVYLGANKISYVFAKVDGDTATIDSMHRIDLNLAGANPSPKIYAAETQAMNLNYFLGYLPQSITNVKANNRIVYKDVYPGIDWHLYSDREGVKYYFVVAPGADPNQILLQYDGATSIDNSSPDALTINSAFGSIEQAGITATSEAVGSPSTPVEVRYEPQGNDYYSLRVSNYDPDKYLVLMVKRAAAACTTSPTVGAHNVLDWSTYFGGSTNDYINDICLGGNNSIYICGYTESSNLPFVKKAGANSLYQSIVSSTTDAFVASFDKDGTPIFSTYYGGSDEDVAAKVLIGGLDGDGTLELFFIGETESSDFPTKNPLSAGSTIKGSDDGFVVKLTADGQLQRFATFFGGGDRDKLLGIATSGSDIYVTGYSIVSNSSIAPIPLVTRAGAYNQGSAIIGTNQRAGIIASFDRQTYAQTWGTYFGGGAATTETEAQNIVATGAGTLYVVGGTNSRTMASSSTTNTACSVPSSTTYFPDCKSNTSTAYHQAGNNTVVSPSQSNTDVFIAEFSSTGSLEWCTLFGGNGDDYSLSDRTNNRLSVHRREQPPLSIAVNPKDNTEFVLAGQSEHDAGTTSLTFPTVTPLGAFSQAQSSFTLAQNEDSRSFIAKFKNRSLNWSTQMFPTMSGMYDVCYDNNNNVYTAGFVNSSVINYSASQCAVPTNYQDVPYCYPSNTFYQSSNAGVINSSLDGDALLCCFSGSNKLRWSTLMGGVNREVGTCNLFDATTGNIYIGGVSNSDCAFPILNPNNNPNRYMQNSSFAPTASPTFNISNNGFINKFKVNFSNVTEINNGINIDDHIILYPNPTQNKLFVTGLENESYNFQIADLYGNISINYLINVLENSINLNTDFLSDGLYILTIKGENYFHSDKFIISK